MDKYQTTLSMHSGSDRSGHAFRLTWLGETIPAHNTPGVSVVTGAEAESEDLSVHGGFSVSAEVFIVALNFVVG